MFFGSLYKLKKHENKYQSKRPESADQKKYAFDYYMKAFYDTYKEQFDAGAMFEHEKFAEFLVELLSLDSTFQNQKVELTLTPEGVNIQSKF